MFLAIQQWCDIDCVEAKGYSEYQSLERKQCSVRRPTHCFYLTVRTNNKGQFLNMSRQAPVRSMLLRLSGYESMMAGMQVCVKTLGWHFHFCTTSHYFRALVCKHCWASGPGEGICTASTCLLYRTCVSVINPSLTWQEPTSEEDSELKYYSTDIGQPTQYHLLRLTWPVFFTLSIQQGVLIAAIDAFATNQLSLTGMQGTLCPYKQAWQQLKV